MKLSCMLPQSPISYDIEFFDGLLTDASLLVSEIKRLGNKCALITDSAVADLFGKKLEKKIRALGVDVALLSFPSGEPNKTRKTKEDLEDELFTKGYGRDSVFVALGGGVVTDVVGFLASTYCRGVPLIMVPTTLLAMVDASIGGKVAVNTPRGKNLVGSFYQPSKVFIDTIFLSSLPLVEYKNGIVEMIKHGLVADFNYFTYLEKHRQELQGRNNEVLKKVILESCRIKKMIVEEDEKDLGKRNLLNFGHTVGHALENVTNHALSHGQAVAIGLAVESYLAVLLGHLSHESFDRILSILQSYDLLVEIPTISLESLLKAMVLDKKTKQGKPQFVMLEEIGKAVQDDFCAFVGKELIEEAFRELNGLDVRFYFNAFNGGSLIASI